ERARNQVSLGLEITHAHLSDNCLHYWLSEADAKSVVARGWGQRFPLHGVDKGWVMLYALRTTDEVEDIRCIVRAGIA
ncbi:uncharacterized protein A1O9_12979, partial [Exophiala aquamarina CBS 119918]